MNRSVLLLACTCVLLAGCRRELDRVVLSPRSIALTEPAATAGFKAEVLDTRGQPMAGQSVSYTSSNPDVVKVDHLGWVTAMKGGTATITATAGGRSDTASVDVSFPARLLVEVGEHRFKAAARTGEAVAIRDRISLPGLNSSVTVRGTLADEIERPIREAPLTIGVTDDGVLSLDKDGVTLQARGYGSTIVTAATDQYTVAFLATVQPPDTIAIQAPRTLTMREGQSQPLAIKLQGIPPQLVRPGLLSYSTSESGIVDVDPSGRVIALRAGRSVVTAAAGDKKALVEVTVLGASRR